MALRSEPPILRLVPTRFELLDPIELQDAIESTAIDRPWLTGDAHLVRQYAGRSRRSDLEPVGLPPRLVAAVWTGAAADVVVGLWMGAIANGKVACTSALCSMSTLGGREVPLGLVALGCALVLLVLAPFTGGHTRAGTPTLALLGFIGLASLGAALGVLAVLLLLTSIFAVLIAVVLAAAGTA